jgi:hypothetical protein
MLGKPLRLRIATIDRERARRVELAEVVGPDMEEGR